MLLRRYFGTGISLWEGVFRNPGSQEVGPVDLAALSSFCNSSKSDCAVADPGAETFLWEAVRGFATGMIEFVL
jgi:hypothetical protein